MLRAMEKIYFQMQDIRIFLGAGYFIVLIFPLS
jgi:hypothetical protein